MESELRRDRVKALIKKRRRYIQQDSDDSIPSPTAIVTRQFIPTRPRSRGLHIDNEARGYTPRTYLNQQIGARVPVWPRGSSGPHIRPLIPSVLDARTYLNQQIRARVPTRLRSGSGRRIRAPPVLMDKFVPDEQAEPDAGDDIPVAKSNHTDYVIGSPPIRFPARPEILGREELEIGNDAKPYYIAETARPEILGREELETGDDAEPCYIAETAGKESKESGAMDVDESPGEGVPVGNHFPNREEGINLSRLPEAQNPDEQQHDHFFRPGRQSLCFPSIQFSYHNSQFHGEISRPRPLQCGFRFSADHDDVIFGGLGLQPDFKPQTMDVVISDRNLFMQDTRGVIKPNSCVRFQTNGLAIEDRIGNMILRIGDPLSSSASGTSEFTLTCFMELFEQTSPGAWERTSMRMLPQTRLGYLRPWPWPVQVDYYDVLGKPDSPQTRYPGMQSFVLLRRKANGEHDHDCQKLDWYSSPKVDPTLIMAGDLLLRFGVENFGPKKRSRFDGAEIVACAEVWCFDGRGWIFEGRDECWLRGHSDAGFHRNWVPGQKLGLTQFAQCS